ncbi:CDP-glycerol glycerophosphotransferase family protein [Enterococcus gallinarum]|nr:CDP-glycerol glycerophosphotransferase family protein [Enterococcus gallinarum]
MFGLNILAKVRKKNNLSFQLATWAAEYYEFCEQDSKMIFYESRDGKNMVDSPKAIFEYMMNHERYKEYTHVWSFDPAVDNWENIIDFYQEQTNVLFVERNTQEYVKYLYESKFLITNATFQSFFIPRKDQVVINTWHGTPLKKMGFDIKDSNPAGPQNVIRNFLFSNYLISPNRHTTNMYLNSFKLDGLYQGEILEAGYPRIDLMHKTTLESEVKKLKELSLNVNLDKKTVLYCPTWKGKDVNNPTSELNQIISESKFLQSHIGSEYNLLVKVHPFIYDAAKEIDEFRGFLVPDSYDPNELMVAIDLLVTDYSSIFFDFMLTDKPILFYCWDKDLYENDRGLYISEDKLPGPVATTIFEIINYIKSIDRVQKEYRQNYEALKNEFLKYEDGNVTHRIISYIFDKHELNLGESIVSRNNKKKLLFYVGGMKNNGITSSLINLLKNIDYSEYDVTCFSGYPHSSESISNIHAIPDEARFLFKPGYAMLSNKEQKLVARYNEKPSEKNSSLLPWDGLKREASRIFSNQKFDVAIDFSGYSFFWSKYILAADSDKKLCYLHSDMLEDKNRTVNGVRIHEMNLLRLFYQYKNFDKLITVSPIMQEVNQAKLSKFVDKDKFTYALNTLDTEKLFSTSKELNEEINILESNTDLVNIRESIEIFKSPFDLESKSQIIKSTDLLRSVAQVKFADEIRYKILINNIFVGWTSSKDVIIRLPEIVSIENVDYFCYVKRNKRRILWKDLPTIEEARVVGKIWDYRYLIVKVTKEAYLSTDQVYVHIQIDSKDLGWIEKSVLNPINSNLMLRKMKNHLSNRNRLRTLNNRTLETVYEEGFARIIALPSNDPWKSALIKDYEKEDINIINGKILKYTMKIQNQNGWYYRLWDRNKFIGWVNEKNLLIIDGFHIVSTENILLKAQIISDYAFSSLEEQKTIEVTTKEVLLTEKCITTLGIYFKTNTDIFVEESKIKVIKSFGKVDLLGNFVLYPQQENFNIVTMGRLSPEKRQAELIEAFNRFVTSVDNARLYILGDGPLRQELIDQIKSLNIADKVFLMGHEKNPFQLLSEAQFFILTSEYEGQPMVLLEAMALGVPVGATNIPATQFVLQNGRLGILAQSNNVEGIENMLIKAYNEKVQPATFNAQEYNKNAIKMFYKQIEEV